MFSWFTRHVAYLLFLTTEAFRLSKSKGNRIIYISGRQQIFLSGIFVRLHSLSFLRLIYPFSDSLVCNFCIPGFVSFQDRNNFFYILAWPRNGEDRERVVCSAPYRSLSFSLRTLPSSFAVAWNIKFPIRVCKLRTSFQEITSLFKGKRQRKKNIDESCLNDWETAYGCFCFFFFSMMW